MNANEYGFLLRYSSSYSILVVTSDDKLIELECPFRVRVIKSVNKMTVSQIKEVTQVKLSTNDKIVYIIYDEPYYYNHFTILL
ncbi:MAG: hypothetical protein ACJA1H_001603 [Glaciecola sp.]|jgi:hypothetical protein